MLTWDKLGLTTSFKGVKLHYQPHSPVNILGVGEKEIAVTFEPHDPE